VDGSGQHLIRLSFSGPTHDRIREGVSRLAAALQEEIAESVSPSAAPAQSAR